MMARRQTVLLIHGIGEQRLSTAASTRLIPVVSTFPN